MNDTMRVWVYDGPHASHIETRSRPEPGPDDVRIRIAHIGICGSDLHGYTGESGRRVPGMVMGHEASGWIEAMGSAVSGLAVGDAVTFNPALPCDGSCGHDVENQCARLRVIGVTPEIQGAFADAIVVQAVRAVRLGEMSTEWGAGIEPMAVALQTSRRAGVAAGASVLVIGGGMIGQCVAQAARLDGATEVVVSDAMAERREVATAAGFRTVAPEDVENLSHFDIAIDAVGISATAAAAIRAVGKGATVCFVGLGTPEVTVPLFDIVVSERQIVGSFCYTHEVFRDAVSHIAAGRLDLGVLIGSQEPFEDIGTTFEALASGARRDVKIMISTGATAP
ncbi:MAG: alcohol dehydrogenase catalytic domain-containing protein [Acidobacteria bacterium]|nr:alcohol dehydrogenase catalytic domain-containing protein [Acidobacteriota bacterium]